MPNVRSRAFTLLELITIIAILAALAAILQPVFVNAKRSAARSACQSNLHQVGLVVELYGDDNNDTYPAAIDMITRDHPEFVLGPHPPIDTIPDIVQVLSTYTGNESLVWRCPADNQSYQATEEEVDLKVYPSVFDYNGTSYFFGPTVYFGKSRTSVDEVTLHICQDAKYWHSDYQHPGFFDKSWNALFGDGHVRFVSGMY